MSEEERFGGYCVFDMSFVEYGKTENPAPDVTAQLLQSSQTMVERVKNLLGTGASIPGAGTPL
jgi:hypothetical protein